MGFCRQEYWSGLPFPSWSEKILSQSESMRPGARQMDCPARNKVVILQMVVLQDDGDKSWRSRVRQTAKNGGQVGNITKYSEWYRTVLRTVCVCLCVRLCVSVCASMCVYVCVCVCVHVLGVSSMVKKEKNDIRCYTGLRLSPFQASCQAGGVHTAKGGRGWESPPPWPPILKQDFGREWLGKLFHVSWTPWRDRDPKRISSVLERRSTPPFSSSRETWIGCQDPWLWMS